MAIFQTDGNSNPFLSAGPEVGWNAGLEGLRPLGSPLYRLWDMKVAWRDVNPAPGVFDWSILDRRIAQTEAWGGKPLMVLGLTPQWAASDPNAGDPRWGAGTASAPASIDSWRSYVRALVQRYGDRIGAYETWNEANLQTFWQGSAAELAVMVSVANQEIKAGSSATVLLPSVTTRLASGYKFTQALLKAFGDNPENFFDAFSIHTYPTGSAGATYKDNCQVTTSPFDCIDTLDPRAAAAERFDDIRTWQQKVVEQVGENILVLRKGLWDTEVNYGLAGPGINPPVDWSDSMGAQLISYTYADSRALGIDATFWYEFTAAPYDLLGVQLTPQTPLTQAAYFALPATPTGTSGQNPTQVSVGGCVIEPLMQCPGAKLRELDVSGMSFRGVDLTNADYYARLEKAGFMLDWGADGSGLFVKYLRRGSGYYIDVGASELISSGDIKLVTGQVRELTQNAVVMDDGNEVPADVVVYATGYGSMNGWAADLISQEVADQVGKVWGLGSGTPKDPGPWEGEERNMWKPTQQSALWFHGGNLHQSRYYSLFLALQLKARYEGLDTPVYRLAASHHTS